jgi:translation initiation factor 1
MKTKATTLVYSTEHGRICAGCGKATVSCNCGKKPAVSPATGVVRVGRETKGRKGKGVTLLSGVPLDEVGLQVLAKELKQRCGCGGTVKAGVIEIQGDHLDLMLEELAKRGWQVKRSGG